MPEDLSYGLVFLQPHQNVSTGLSRSLLCRQQHSSVCSFLWSSVCWHFHEILCRQLCSQSRLSTCRQLNTHVRHTLSSQHRLVQFRKSLCGEMPLRSVFGSNCRSQSLCWSMPNRHIWWTSKWKMCWCMPTWLLGWRLYKSLCHVVSSQRTKLCRQCNRKVLAILYGWNICWSVDDQLQCRLFRQPISTGRSLCFWLPGRWVCWSNNKNMRCDMSCLFSSLWWDHNLHMCFQLQWLWFCRQFDQGMCPNMSRYTRPWNIFRPIQLPMCQCLSNQYQSLHGEFDATVLTDLPDRLCRQQHQILCLAMLYATVALCWHSQ